MVQDKMVSFCLTCWLTDPLLHCLPQIPLPLVDDRRKVQDDVDKDRKHAIEAAIVRIMKSRKALQHQQVCTRVGGKFSFGCMKLRKALQHQQVRRSDSGYTCGRKK